MGCGFGVALLLAKEMHSVEMGKLYHARQGATNKIGKRQS